MWLLVILLVVIIFITGVIYFTRAKSMFSVGAPAAFIDLATYSPSLQNPYSPLSRTVGPDAGTLRARAEAPWMFGGCNKCGGQWGNDDAYLNFALYSKHAQPSMWEYKPKTNMCFTEFMRQCAPYCNQVSQPWQCLTSCELKSILGCYKPN